MAKHNSTQPPETTPIQALHQRFDWICDSVNQFPGADFASITHDIAGGVQTCLEIIEKSELDRSNNEGAEPDQMIQPTLSVADTGRLLRLAIAANNLLHAQAERHIEWVNSHGEKYLVSRGFTGSLAKSPYA